MKNCHTLKALCWFLVVVMRTVSSWVLILEVADYEPQQLVMRWISYFPELQGKDFLTPLFVAPIFSYSMLSQDFASRLQIQLGVNMPSRAEHIQTGEETQMFHLVYDVVLYLGIIDILQDYNMSKKIEHAYKSLQFDSFSISAVDPTLYSKRFLEFIQKVFPENENA